jgi:hypothetical protein
VVVIKKYYTSGGYDLIDNFNQRFLVLNIQLTELVAILLITKDVGLVIYGTIGKIILKQNIIITNEMYLDLFNNWQD